MRKRKISKKRRHRLMYQKMESDYNKFMNEHLEQVNNPHTGAHPLYYVSEKEFMRLKDNALIVSNPSIRTISRDNRQVKYCLEEIGKNWKFKRVKPET